MNNEARTSFQGGFMRVKNLAGFIIGLGSYILILSVSSVFRYYRIFDSNIDVNSTVAISFMITLFSYLIIKIAVKRPVADCNYALTNRGYKLMIMSVMFIGFLLFIVLTSNNLNVPDQLEFILLGLVSAYCLLVVLLKDGIYGDVLYLRGQVIREVDIVGHKTVRGKVKLSYVRNVFFMYNVAHISTMCNEDEEKRLLQFVGES